MSPQRNKERSPAMERVAASRLFFASRTLNLDKFESLLLQVANLASRISPKAITMATKLTEVSAIAYSGSLEELPTSASPGLLFVKAWIAKVDSLDNDDSDGVESMFSPNAMIFYNAEPPKPAHAKDSRDNAQRHRAKRNKALQSIEREFDRAWDIDNGNGTRTVVYHTRNIFYFAADPDNPLVMPEACTVTLERVPHSKASTQTDLSETVASLGVAGFWATEFQSWHDRVGMMKKREELGC
jgi:hypothetical protein